MNCILKMRAATGQTRISSYLGAVLSYFVLHDCSDVAVMTLLILISGGLHYLPPQTMYKPHVYAFAQHEMFPF